MDFAATNGHLEVVKFLYFNRTDERTTYAINMATEYGHLEVVEWLRVQNEKRVTSQ
jgi:hypothetical protein